MGIGRIRRLVQALIALFMILWAGRSLAGWERFRADIEPAEDVLSVAIGDCDNDRDNEVVAGGHGSGIMVYDGARSSWIAGQVAGGLKVNCVVVADADNDGAMEIVCSTEDKCVILYESPEGEWVEHMIDPDVGQHVKSLCCGDADNDLENEVVIGTDEKRVYLYRHSGDSWSRAVVDKNARGDVCAISIGDADGDGQKDLVCGTDNKDIYLYKKSGQKWVRHVVDDNAGAVVRSIAVGDCDGDGKPEIVEGSERKRLYQYEWNGRRWWSEEIDRDVGGPLYGLGMTDTDGDGTDEFAAMARGGREGSKLLLYDRGPSGWLKTVIDDEVEGDARALACGDADDDGIVEMALGTSKKRNVFVYDNWFTLSVARIAGVDDIQIAWPSDRGTTYEIYYSKLPYNGFTYAASVTAKADTTRWTDNGNAIGVHPRDVVARYYRIRGVGSACFSNTVGKFTRKFGTEMHLTSIPLVPYSSSIQDVIGDQLTGAPDEGYADRVWKWDRVTEEFDFAWLVDSIGPGYDGTWWCSNPFGPSTMALGFGEGFFVQTRHENQKITFVGSVPGGVVNVAEICPGMQIIGTAKPETLLLDNCGFKDSGGKGGRAELSADRVIHWNEEGLFYQYSWLVDSTGTVNDGKWWCSDPWGPSHVEMKPGYGYWYQARGKGFGWKFSK